MPPPYMLFDWFMAGGVTGGGACDDWMPSLALICAAADCAACAAWAARLEWTNKQKSENWVQFYSRNNSTLFGIPN